MDPDVALATLRDLARRATSGEPWNDSTEASDLAIEMAEAWEGLDEWLTRGGFIPAAWRAASLDQMAHRVAEALEAAAPTGVVVGEDERAVIRAALQGAMA